MKTFLQISIPYVIGLVIGATLGILTWAAISETRAARFLAAKHSAPVINDVELETKIAQFPPDLQAAFRNGYKLGALEMSLYLFRGEE